MVYFAPALTTSVRELTLVALRTEVGELLLPSLGRALEFAAYRQLEQVLRGVSSAPETPHEAE